MLHNTVQYPHPCGYSLYVYRIWNTHIYPKYVTDSICMYYQMCKSCECNDVSEEWVLVCVPYYTCLSWNRLEVLHSWWLSWGVRLRLFQSWWRLGLMWTCKLQYVNIYLFYTVYSYMSDCSVSTDMWTTNCCPFILSLISWALTQISVSSKWDRGVGVAKATTTYALLYFGTKC